MYAIFAKVSPQQMLIPFRLGIRWSDERYPLPYSASIVNLCVAACRCSGEGIPTAETGGYFIQGKTEADLYHAEAQFQKIYPRDVNRYFENGKLSIVIYPISFANSASASSAPRTSSLVSSGHHGARQEEAGSLITRKSKRITCDHACPPSPCPPSPCLPPPCPPSASAWRAVCGGRPRQPRARVRCRRPR